MRIPRALETLDFETMSKRLWAKVEKTDQCWLWIGSLTENGYGKMSFRVNGKDKSWLAHRISYWLSNGVDPGNLFVLHACDIRKCVRPEHLFLGTQRDNLRDMYAKNRNDCSQLIRFESGERNINAIINAEIALEIKKLLRQGVLQQDIANRFGVTRYVVSNISRGGAWKHVALEGQDVTDPELQVDC